MFSPTVAVSELMLRAVIIYVFVFVLLRLLGKKHVGEMAPFDLVILLILSESVQNALVSDDKSVTGGLIVAATLFALSQGMGFITWKSKRAERFLDGTPRILVRNGHVYLDALKQEQLTHGELLEALRREGCTSLSKVRYAVLENDGAITIGLRAEGKGVTGAHDRRQPPHVMGGQTDNRHLSRWQQSPNTQRSFAIWVAHPPMSIDVRRAQA